MASDPMKQIPNISLRELKTNNSETMKRLAEACRYWGFFRLIDLELERGATDQVLAAMKIFFNYEL